MKKNRLGSLAILILLASLMGFSWHAAALAAGDWQELPPLALEDCVVVEKVLAPNPLSPSENEFWMVLKYEEKDQSAGGIGLMSTGSGSLNMYLVTGLAVFPEESLGLSYYQFLIVTFTGDGSSDTVLQWLLSDKNNDGTLDNARFERTTLNIEGEPVQTEKVEIPLEQIQPFQEYFEKADRELNNKAENGTTSQCRTS